MATNQTTDRASYHVGGSKNQHTRLILSHTIHLNQELVKHLALTSTSTASLRVKKKERRHVTRTTERINFIYKNDRRLLITSHLKHLLDKASGESMQTVQTEHSLPATSTPGPKKTQT